MRFRLAWIIGVALGLAVADFEPFATTALAQRSNDDDEDRDERAERWRRWREQRENGEGRDDEGGDRRERWRRFREQRERDDEGRDEGDRRGRDRDDENRDRDANDDEDSNRGRRGPGRGRRWGGQMDYAEYARNLVRQHDKNNNMILDGDEVNQLRGPAASADANGDKAITVDELVARFSNRGSSERRDGEQTASGSSSASESKTSAASEGSKTRVYTWLGVRGTSKENEEKRKSYRFTPASELWGSAPSRIKSRDRNEDGQVSMSEFSRSWSDRTVREFARYDLNGDGVITPKEAAE